MKTKLNCVLLVDDDEPTNFFNRMVLEDIDCVKTIRTADSGQNALDYLEHAGNSNSDHSSPDLIFLDINMPIMDGKETLRNIRKDQRFHSVPIYIFSTSVSKKDAELCRVLGADKCMVKPSSFQKLIADLKEAIKGKRDQSIN